MPPHGEARLGSVFGSLSRSLGRSTSWAPTVAFSWLWGLGFFYAIHVTLTYGWLGFLAFAVSNAGGLCLFGWILGAPGRDPAKIFASVESAYAGLFLLAQLGAVSITIFALIAYLWQPLALQAPLQTSLPSPLVGVGLLLLVGCAIGQATSLRRLRWVHAAGLVLGVGAASVALAGLAQQSPVPAPPPLAEFDARFYGLVIPTLVGFLLGPWTDVQQWQRTIEIRRGGGSVRAAYGLGSLLFFGLLGLNAALAAFSGAGGLVAADGIPAEHAAVTLALARIGGTGGGWDGATAFALWTVSAVLAQVASAYCAVRWWLGSVTARSNAPLLAIIPAGLVASPLWIVLASLGLALVAVSAGLSLIYLMLPFATLLVAAAACLLCETLGAPRRYDSVLCWLIGLAAALIFLVGHVAPNAALVAISPLIGLVGALPMILGLISPRRAPMPAVMQPSVEAAAVPKLAVLTVTDTDATASYGFEGQWFVLRMMPTYDDTNSVGNVYFANYVRWVGKARELFFNICMPEFDLKTTAFYILTKNFEHEFRREATEFEPVTIRIRIARHNRKFVTLVHEIHSDVHGLLGRGEQGLMFVDSKTYHPLDIPRTIVQGFLRYWPKDSPHAEGASGVLAPSLATSERGLPEPAAIVR